MNIDRYRDDARTILSIAGLVLAGGMIFGGAVFTYHLWDKTSLRESYADELTKVRDEKGVEIRKLETRNETLSGQITKLTTIIEQRLPLIVETQADLTEKLDKTTDRVGKAANTANRAASRAGQAVKKSREPGKGIRIVPSKPAAPKCYMGRDLYGDTC